LAIFLFLGNPINGGETVIFGNTQPLKNCPRPFHESAPELTAWVRGYKRASLRGMPF
jgi:hypothetical protein